MQHYRKSIRIDGIPEAAGHDLYGLPAAPMSSSPIPQPALADDRSGASTIRMHVRQQQKCSVLWVAVVLGGSAVLLGALALRILTMV